MFYYFVIINLFGYFLMAIDKTKAKKGRYRISEKTLFFVAFLFGAVGIFVAMYQFRHKTKHRSFTLGIPLIIFLQFVIIAVYFFFIKELVAPL